MTVFKVRKTDMESKYATFIVDSANIIAERESAKDPEVFLGDLKNILDMRFGGDWNLLIGNSMGYAMKTRKKASVILSRTTGEMLVCWRSPGFEVEDLDVVKIKTRLTLEGKDEVVSSDADVKKLNLISVPQPDSFGYTVDTAAATRIVDALVDEVKDMEYDEAARFLRNKYV